MKKKIYLCISIDTECDKAPDWSIPRPLSFLNIRKQLPELLIPMFKKYALKPTFLLSPEVIQDDACVDFFKNLDNCSLGTHLHGEFIDPAPQYTTLKTSMPQCFYPPGIEKEKLENLTLLFIEKFGFKPLSFRAGRFGISNNTLGFLQDLGYTVDSSVSPFKTHYFEQGSLNFWGSPVLPYYPSSLDFRKKGKMRILQVPVTIFSSSYLNWPTWVLRKLNDREKLHKKISFKLGNSIKPVRWLRPMRSSLAEMVGLANDLSKYAGGQPPVLNMMFHSNELLINGSPYVRNAQDLNNFIDTLENFFRYLKENYELCSKGLEEIPDLYKKE